MKGGIGPCGREICCATFMTGFHPVSIKMAKEQNISLNPTKISGLCGRLMCCLAHEYEVYRNIRPKLKRVGSYVMTPEGPGVVADNLILLEMCKVRVSFPGENIEMKQYSLDDVKSLSKDEADKQFAKVKKMKPQENLFVNPSETWDKDEPKKEKPKKRNNYNRNNKRTSKNNNNQRNNNNSGNNRNSGANNNNAVVNNNNKHTKKAKPSPSNKGDK